MFIMGMRYVHHRIPGCDFHEKDACGSAGSASFTATGFVSGVEPPVPGLERNVLDALEGHEPQGRGRAGLATPNKSESTSSTPKP